MHRVRDHAQRETIKIFGLGEGHLLWVGWSLLRRTERPQERGRADDSLHAAQPIVLCALANRTNGPDPPDCVTALDTGRISSAPMQIGPLQLLVIPSISIGIAMRCAPRTASRQTRCWRDAVMFAAKRDGCGYAFHNVAP